MRSFEKVLAIPLNFNGRRNFALHRDLEIERIKAIPQKTTNTSFSQFIRNKCVHHTRSARVKVYSLHHYGVLFNLKFFPFLIYR